MNKQESVELFTQLHPNFFESESIRGLPEEWIYDEMVLPLDEFDPGKYDKKLADNVSFGIYAGDLGELKAAVAAVDDDWVQYFTEGQRFYCGYVDGKIASFCMIADEGLHRLNGRTVKVGGPGCVGTVPEYRNRGVGLTMVQRVTQILKDEGYDYSYIHYTAVASWYERLGYRTSIRWTRNGIL